MLDFEERFATEEAYRNYLAKSRWPDGARCTRYGRDHVWAERNGRLFQSSKCGHKASLISDTLFHGTLKPLKLGFRAIWEIYIHLQGISAFYSQRVLGFGSYDTAWAWAHRIRRTLVREDREPLEDIIQLDETFVGGKT
ncbi:MAG TPA: IS1595 family transposase ISDth3 [Hyphomicrobiaceae bacterium MAG_BT-2024]